MEEAETEGNEQEAPVEGAEDRALECIYCGIHVEADDRDWMSDGGPLYCFHRSCAEEAP